MMTPSAVAAPALPIMNILDRALQGTAPNREDCIRLIELPENSLEAAWVRATADFCSRRRFGHAGMLLGQIGLEAFPCPANCGFCAFGLDHAHLPEARLEMEEVSRHIRVLTQNRNLYAVFLMMMHEFDFDGLLKTVECVRGILPPTTCLVLNIGDFDVAQARELKAAGVSGAYHVLRLREGKDTNLDPKVRVATIRAIKDAGMDWYNCCEPIGPEHTAAELADQLMLGREFECFQHAAMRRVMFAGSPLVHRGQVSDLRLAQIVAVTSLAMIENPALRTMAVHEPNLIGLTSGANTIYVERGVNPRDLEPETANGLVRNIEVCTNMLWEAGFNRLATADGHEVKVSG